MAIRIAFIDMGEAGRAFCAGWGENPPESIAAYDIKIDQPKTADAMWARYEQPGIRGCYNVAESVAGADLVLCTVTADQAVAAAERAAVHLECGTFWGGEFLPAGVEAASLRDHRGTGWAICRCCRDGGCASEAQHGAAFDRRATCCSDRADACWSADGSQGRCGRGWGRLVDQDDPLGDCEGGWRR